MRRGCGTLQRENIEGSFTPSVIDGDCPEGLGHGDGDGCLGPECTVFPCPPPCLPRVFETDFTKRRSTPSTTLLLLLVDNFIHKNCTSES